MGTTKRIRISQRMSQHIMQLKFALRITASAGKTYQHDMFIAHMISFVNTFFTGVPADKRLRADADCAIITEPEGGTAPVSGTPPEPDI